MRHWSVIVCGRQASCNPQGRSCCEVIDREVCVRRSVQSVGPQVTVRKIPSHGGRQPLAGNLDSAAGKTRHGHLAQQSVSTNCLAYEVAALHLRRQRSPVGYDEFKRTTPGVAVDLLLNQVHRRGPPLQFGLPNTSDVCKQDHPHVDCSVLTSSTLRNNTRHCLAHPGAESTLHNELKDDNKAL
jgi:hypothetical protein